MLPFLPNVSRPSSLDAKLGGRRTEGLAVAGLEMVGLTALLRQHRGVSGDGGTEVARAVAWAVATKAGARVAGAMATGVVRTSQNQAARRKRHFGPVCSRPRRDSELSPPLNLRRPRKRFARMAVQQRVPVKSSSLEPGCEFARGGSFSPSQTCIT